MAATSDKIANGHWGRYLERVVPELDARAVLELGVLEGASLDLWADTWPDARVVGIDNAAVLPLSSRWTAYSGDQADAALLGRISAEHGPWDLVVDDAAHIGELSAASFLALWPHVAPGGCYVVEDWGTGYWEGWPDGSAAKIRSDAGMVGFVKSLIDLIDGNGAGLAPTGVERVEFLPAMAIVWRAA